MSEVPIRYKVAEDEKIENIEISRSKFHGGIKHLSFMPDFLTIPRPGILFITTKKIIFEKRNADSKKKYDDFEIPHTDIKKTEGKNKTLLDLTSNYAYLKIITFEGKEIQIVGIKNGKDISEILNEKYYLNEEYKKQKRLERDLDRSDAEKRRRERNRIKYDKERKKYLEREEDRKKKEEERKKKEEERKKKEEVKHLEVAKRHEKLLEFDEAANIYKELGMDDDTIRVRKLKAEQGSVKVTQKVVHGDEVTKTEIKDSVLNRSNVGGGTSKAEQLREAKSLLEEGLIDDDEFKQMKKEILGK